jgi:hypothetical protein
MTTETKIRQGTTAWFEMVGTLMSEAALQSGLSSELNLSLVERCTDGVELAEGLVKAFASTSSMASRRLGSGRGGTSART